MTDYFILCDVMVFGFGIYLFYLWYKICVKGEPDSKSFLVPRDKAWEKCKDVESYRKSISPWMLLTAACMTVAGGLMSANDKAAFLPMWGVWILMGVLLTETIIFSVALKKKMDRFWD